MADTSYEDWAKGREDARFTDWLREQSGPAWNASVRHRFVSELADGSLPDAVMARYLIQDYSFLDSFVRLVGSAIVKAPALSDRIPFARFLGMVTSDENTYFQRAFDALGVGEADRHEPALRAPTRGFHQVMATAVAADTYEATLAPLVVFEWLYYEWARAVADRQPGSFYLREWIDLHCNADFARFVDWLRAQLDRGAAALPVTRQAELASIFRHTVELEKAFFDEAYVD